MADKHKNNAQDCLYKLCDELLGKDYYIVDPVGANQANEIITEDIIRLYNRKTIREKLIALLGS
jgi:hypothetical protein